MKKYLLTAVVFFLFVSITSAQNLVNGSFELIKHDKAPRAWISGNKYNSFNITQSPVRTGKNALRITRNKASLNTSAAIAANVFGDMSAKKLTSIIVTAWVNTDKLADSSARIFIQTSDTIIYDKSIIKLNAGWQRQTVSYIVPFSKSLYRFYYGIEVRGNATVVCDDFSIHVDSEEIKDPIKFFREPNEKSI